MFSPELQSEARDRGHMTVDDAARVALRAGVGKAVLVHLSPRYRDEDIEELTMAAKKRFQQAEIGRDLQSYQVKFRDSNSGG